MGYRTVVMYMEIGCFVVCVAGWILVCSTMPTEIWTWSEVDSIVLTTSNYFSNLWKDCISDSTGVSDCKGIPSMLALNWMCSMVAFSYYGNKIRAEFQDPNYRAQKFEIGVGVFIGWGGSTLLVVGGLIYSIFAGREGCRSSPKRYPGYQYADAYMGAPTKKEPVYLARTEVSESRKSRTSSGSRGSSVSGLTSITKTTDSSGSGVTSITKTTASNAYV
ncbi:claudin-10-like [Solea senegalensis]|uniref:Claudin n=1 Tax=Solea senegalensis TaxID=28829 RepID=A0AAV6R8L6_SOLSE|nr:claudin-10-like [Solea senegalensis]